jgi:hypothetical protein
MLDSWVKILDPNFINAELIGTEGAELVVTIKDIDFAECYDEGTKQKVKKQTVFFEETKPLVLNKTNTKTLKKLFSPNSDNPADAVGHRIVLKVEKVKAFGKTVDAIRIKEYSETKCADCGKVILPWAGHSVAEIIEMGNKNCGRALCVDCMKKEKEKKDAK